MNLVTRNLYTSRAFGIVANSKHLYCDCPSEPLSEAETRVITGLYFNIIYRRLYETNIGNPT